MAHNIPKIEYGDFIPTIIELDYPPVEEGGEVLDPKERSTVSISGQRQVSVDFVEAIRSLKFSFLSEAKKAALETFFKTHAYLGKSFKYFDDKTSLSFTNYELRDLKFQPRKIASVGANVYSWEIPFTFRRILGDTGGDFVTTTINNNQVSATNLVGAILDSTSYKSAKIFAEIFRKTSLAERVSNGYLTATYKEDTLTWDITPDGTFDGDLHGVEFSILASGQIQYVSDSMAGTDYQGVMKLKSFVFA